MSEMVSVIIPVYNGEKYIDKCLSSIRSQMFLNLEIIVVDDGSIDNTIQIIDKHRIDDSRIKLFKQLHQGVSAARNLGMEKATGKYCCFVDADDFVSDMYIQKLYEGMTLNDVDMSTVANYYQDKSGKWGLKTKGVSGVISQKEALMNFFAKDGMKCGPVSKMFKKDILDNFRIRFDTNICIAEDKLFGVEYITKCERVYFSSTPEYYYVYNSLSASNKKRYINNLEDSCLPFVVLDKIANHLPDDHEILKAYYLFDLQTSTRVIWKYRLEYQLSGNDFGLVTKRLKKDLLNCGITVSKGISKSVLYSLYILVCSPVLRKLKGIG